VLEIGAPPDITRHYNEVNFGRSVETETGATLRLGEQARVAGTWCENAAGERIVGVDYGERCSVCLEVEFLQPVRDAYFAVAFRNEVMQMTFVPTSGNQPVPGPFAPGETVVVRLTFDNWLAAGRYTLTPSVATLEEGYRVLDERVDVASLLVESPFGTPGAVDIPTQLEIKRP
jgi:hypothetical protein